MLIWSHRRLLMWADLWIRQHIQVLCSLKILQKIKSTIYSPKIRKGLTNIIQIPLCIHQASVWLVGVIYHQVFFRRKACSEPMDKINNQS